MTPTPEDTTTELILQPMQSQQDADAFRTLNEEWIQHHFHLEEKDRRTLNDPEGEIVAKGGKVYLARLGEQRVGCAALLHYGEDGFELSKMAVTPEMRGQGVGRRLLAYTLDQARQLGACRVFLGSNSVLASAVRLYESLGFWHVPPTDLPHLGYVRANVYMTFDLRAAVTEPTQSTAAD